MRHGRNTISTFLVAALLTAAGCEKERVVFDGPHFVRFTETEAFARESFSRPILLQVHNSGPVQDEDVIVNFTVGGTAREGVDYEFAGDPGSVVIPAGEHFGEIAIELINNSNNILRSQDIVITLTGVNQPELRVGQGESGIGKTHTFTIFDDCILGGYYSGQSGPTSLPVRDLTVTSTDCEQYVLSNWNIRFFDTPFEMDLLFVDNGDNTLTIPSQEEDTLPEELATISGTGIVDPVGGVIEITLTLHDFEDAPTVTFTLTPD